MPASNEPGETDDTDLKMLTAKRMLELRKRISLTKAKKAPERAAAPMPSDREIVLKALSERGDEVLAAAEASYPSQMKLLIPQLATLIRQGKIDKITGGEFLQFLRSLGLRVSVQTSISVEDHGKFVSLSDKLKNPD
jgi:DNA-binding TFAR19-related protein (PDSD5 family)